MGSYGYILTYIIPYSSNVHSITNLKRVISWATGFSKIELIIVEQDNKSSKLQHLNNSIAKVVFLKTDYPYNRALCYNIGVNKSNSDVIVFGDVNYIMHPHHLIESYNMLNNYDFIQANHKIINLTENESVMSFNNIFNIDGNYDNEITELGLCDGITLIKKESFYKIHGWDESFFTYECENIVMGIKINKFLKYAQMPYKLYHLYDNYKNDDYENKLSIEKEIVDDLVKMNDANFLNYMNVSSIKGYGNMSKYINYP